MQQTNQYLFNLIEPGDKFLPDPLNENMEKVEAALGTCARVVFGTYVGNGTYGSGNPNTLTFEQEPKFLLIWGSASYRAVGSRGNSLRCFYGQYTTGLSATWTENTVTWHSNAGSAAAQLNDSGDTYYYLAIC